MMSSKDKQTAGSGDKVEDIPEDKTNTTEPVNDETEAVLIAREVVGEENNKSSKSVASPAQDYPPTVKANGTVEDCGDGAAGEEINKADDDDDDDDDVVDGELLEEGERNKMFERGLAMDRDGNKSAALKCYLRCLVGLKKDSKFALLPQCLRNIGDIYYGKNEYEKAISFIQAEKLYYESVLIDDSDLQKHIDEVTSTSGDGDTNIDVLRAAEYEQLAKLCMDEKQPQLALEYAGKATKLRQKVYGDDHPLVKQSLDYFAEVYAEVGKVQYAESLRKLDDAGEPDMSGGADLSQSQQEPTSILRKRKNTEGDKEEKKVRFDESQIVPSEEMEREEKCAVCFLFVLFLLLVFVLLLLGLFIYCSLYPSDTCHNVHQFINNSVMKVRFWFYQLSNKEGSKYG